MTISMRVLPRFPARITGTAGITVDRTVGSVDLVVKPDYGDLTVIPAALDADTTFFALWQEELDMYVRMSFTDVFAGITGLGFMSKAVYDPQNKNADAFARANHTGTQAISTVTSLQATLDAKLPLAGGALTGPVTSTSSIRAGGASGGTPNGNATLTAESAANAVVQTLSPNAGTCSYYFGDVADASIGRITYNHTTDSMFFWVNGAERGRFVSSGEFLIGRTSELVTAADNGVVLDPQGALATARNGTANEAHYRVINNAAVTPAVVGSITSSGSATAFNTSSDERLKKNFRDFDSGSLIDGINVYLFDWKNGGTGYGVKAQECQEVFPDAIFPGVGEPGDDDFMSWSADYSKFVPLLLREIQHLRDRVAALEAK